MPAYETFYKMQNQGFAYSGYSFRTEHNGWLTKWIKNEAALNSRSEGQTTIVYTNEQGSIVALSVYSARIDEQGRFWRSTSPL